MKLLSSYAAEGVFKSLSYQDLVSAVGKLRVAESRLWEAEYCVKENSDEDRMLGYRYERLNRFKDGHILSRSV